jgi:hypothetical protein
MGTLSRNVSASDTTHAILTIHPVCTFLLVKGWGCGRVNISIRAFYLALCHKK